MQSVLSVPSSLAIVLATAATVLPAAAAAPPGGVPLPVWNEPAAYEVDLVVQSPDGSVTIRRNVDGGRLRSRLAVEGQEIILIETPEAGGTTYTLMPAEKMALKQSTAAWAAETPAAEAETAPEEETPDAEYLGEESVAGRAAKKYRVATSEGTGLAWFDAKDGMPLRFEADVEGGKAVMEWKNFRAGPQKKDLFEIPKGWEVQDLDEVMKQMQAMGGMPGMEGFGGMMGGAAGQFGAGLGAHLGGALGGAFGGPLGAMAGSYVGGKLGGMMGR